MKYKSNPKSIRKFLKSSKELNNHKFYLEVAEMLYLTGTCVTLSVDFPQKYSLLDFLIRTKIRYIVCTPKKNAAKLTTIIPGSVSILLPKGVIVSYSKSIGTDYQTLVREKYVAEHTLQSFVRSHPQLPQFVFEMNKLTEFQKKIYSIITYGTDGSIGREAWANSNSYRLTDRFTSSEFELVKYIYTFHRKLCNRMFCQSPIIVRGNIYFPDIRIGKVIIEVDGGYHDTPEQKLKDERRTIDLQSIGYRVRRIRNEQVEDYVFIDKLLRKTCRSTPCPNPDSIFLKELEQLRMAAYNFSKPGEEVDAEVDLSPDVDDILYS